MGSINISFILTYIYADETFNHRESFISSRASKTGSNWFDSQKNTCRPIIMPNDLCAAVKKRNNHGKLSAVFIAFSQNDFHQRVCVWEVTPRAFNVLECLTSGVIGQPGAIANDFENDGLLALPWKLSQNMIKKKNHVCLWNYRYITI